MNKSKNQAVAIPSKKWYGIRKGFKVGVFNLTFKDLELLVKGVKGAEFKRFELKEEAETYVYGVGEPGFEVKDLKRCECCQFEIDQSNQLKHLKSIELHQSLRKSPLIIYCDGSYLSTDSKPIGCGIGVYFDENSPLNLGAPMSIVTKVGPRTCTRAEIAAAIKALQLIEKFPEYPVIIRTDSNDLVKAMNFHVEKWLTAQWKRKTTGRVLNWDLFEILLLLVRKRTANVVFEHVSGHSDFLPNDMADWLAKQGAKMDIGFKYFDKIIF